VIVSPVTGALVTRSVELAPTLDEPGSHTQQPRGHPKKKNVIKTN